jgi:uncharacterized membrane protein YwaF
MNQNRAIGLLVLIILVAAIISYTRAVLEGVTWSFWSTVPGSNPLRDVHPWDYLAMAIIIICAIVFMWQYQKKK